MAKSAYEDLMESVGEYSRSESFARDQERERKRKEAEEAERKRKAEEERKAAEKRGGTGGRMREGYERRNELYDAIKGDKPKKGGASDSLFRLERGSGGVRG